MSATVLSRQRCRAMPPRSSAPPTTRSSSTRGAGSNTIAALRVRGDGSHLAPSPSSSRGELAAASCGRARHAAGRGQLSNEVVSLTVDLRTGVPGRVRHRVEAPSPTQLLAWSEAAPSAAAPGRPPDSPVLCKGTLGRSRRAGSQ
ncbi:hypothetical protein [Microbacterium sp. NIBRBAC000506063]|uniref:hypothetical protein n=1 Tax=Microbacterium sp. NIBRBAC000506063 TaxID=2734618 RepID=UPI001CB7434A|nr:hypothetical protein [Microbacterium sp. NIBRBAC000506063]